MRGAGLFVVLTSLGTMIAPHPAFALPTPDVIIGTASAIPTILSALAALLALLIARVRRLADRFDDPRAALAAALTIATAFSLLAAGVALHERSARTDGERVLDLAAYYRCDPAAHERLVEGSGRRYFAARATPSSFREVESAMALGARPKLVFVGTKLQYESAIPVVRGVPFEHVQGVSNTFAPALASALSSPSERTLVIANPPGHLDAKTQAALDAWGEIRIVYTDCEDDACLEDFAPYARRRTPSGELVPAIRTPDAARDWPVAEETWLFDEAAVRVPNLTKLLSSGELEEAIEDPQVVIVAPFSSTLRSLEVERFYLNELLELRENVAIVDFDSPALDAELSALAARIGPRRYVVAALTKYDWLYLGTDLVFRFAKLEPRYLGATMQLAEHAARRSLARADAEAAGAWAELRRAVVGLGGGWWSILGLAFLLRLITSPFAFHEALATRMRARLARDRSGLFSGVSDAALSAMGARPALAAAGLAGAWLPAFLAFPLLLYPGGPIDGKLLRPDPGALAIFAIALLLRLAIRAQSISARSATIGALLAGAAALAMSRLPSGITAFAGAFVALGLPIDLLGRIRAHREIRSLLSPRRREATPSPADRDGVTVSALEAFADDGSKAGSLADLSRLETPLFRVPRGVVVSGLLFSDRDAAEAAELAKKDLGPGPFAVRSSAAGEDRVGATQAGRYRSELDVPRSELAVAIKAVAESYGRKERVRVIVQEMIAAKRAGVAFSRLPASPGLTMVESGDGLAAARLQGHEEPDAVLLSRLSGRRYPSASRPDRASELAALAARVVERAFGSAQDIEWAHDGRQLWLVQARRARSASAVLEAEQERLVELLVSLDGGMLVESDALPRRASRLSASIVARAYSDGLPRAMHTLRARGRPTRALVSYGRLLTSVEPAARARALDDRRARKELDRISLEVERAEASAPEIAARTRSGEPRSLAVALNEIANGPSRVAFEAAILAASLEGSASLRVTTVTSELYSGLAAVARGEDTERFLARFGHRAPNDYELSEPSFSEDRTSLLAYSKLHASFPTPRARPDDSLAARGLALKERAKDAAIRCLRATRPGILALGSATGADPFELDLDDLSLPPETLCEVSRRRASERASVLDVDLPSPLTLEAAELLGAPVGPLAASSGRFVSGRRRFAGRATLQRALPSGEPVVWVVPALSVDVIAELPNVAGLVSNVGGALSHPAIVARELDVPVLVWPGATRAIGDGDWIEVLSSGLVRIEKQRREG
ncbi:MAG: hypothetical protein HYV07_11685 [Deltaproteobacteria bacterium]|nr:hypothetical protein [Deltaproteobacteria bacterium]